MSRTMDEGRPASDPVTQPAADDGFVLEDFVPFKLAVLSNTVSKLIARDYSERFGLSISEWRVLVLVGQYSSVRASVVVDKTPMDKVAVSRAVASLVDKGLLVKTPSEIDRRASLLSLSATGADITRRIQHVSLSHDAAILSVLSEQERAQFNDLLDRLIGKAQDLSRR